MISPVPWRRKNRIPKSLVIFYEQVLPELPEDRFCQFFRMTREGFLYILSVIKDSAVFHNNSHLQQAPPAKQLAVALRRLCTESSIAGSCINTAQVFGIAEGTIVLYTRRVIKALMDVWQETIRWPTEREKREMCKRLNEDQRRQWADARALNSLDLAQYPERYFRNEEYLLGDSAYKLTKQLIVPFKRSTVAGSLTRPKRHFNTHLSKPRVRVDIPLSFKPHVVFSSPSLSFRNESSKSKSGHFSFNCCSAPTLSIIYFKVCGLFIVIEYTS